MRGVRALFGLLRSEPFAAAAATIYAVMALVAALAPMLAPHDPQKLLRVGLTVSWGA